MTTTEGPYYERSESVVTAPVVNDPVVVEPGFAPPATAVPVATVVTPAPVVTAARARTSYSSRFSPDALIAGLVGLVALVMGLIAVTRAGIDGPMSDPVVQVLGFNHTATLGFIEIGIGLCLLLSAISLSRGAEMFFGAVLGIGSFVGAVQTDSFQHSLALESAMAWCGVIAGAIVVLSALMMPRYFRHSTTVESI